MNAERKMKIGVIIGNLEAPHAFELASGMSHAAEEMEKDLIFYPSMFTKTYYSEPMASVTMNYDYQNTSIFPYISRENTDVLLISMGTIRYYMNLEENGIKDFLKSFTDIPCLILEDKVDGYPSITLDNKKGLYDCITHMICDHHYKKIGFVNGNTQNFDSQERLSVYEDVMEKYGLPHDESYIVYGEFSEFSDDKVGELLNRHPDLDAIAFANDMMAIGGYREIKRRGLSIGEDIGVTGFDDYVLSMSMEPSLTTVRVSPYRLGYQAILEAIRLAEGEKIDDITIPSEFVCRASCGCGQMYPNLDERTSVEQEREEIVEQISGNIVYYTAGTTTYDYIKSHVRKFIISIETIICSDPVDPHNREYLNIVRNLMNTGNIRIVHGEKLFSVLSEYMKRLLTRCSEQKKQIVLDTFSQLFIYISNYISNDYQKAIIDYRKQLWYTTFITRDAMMYYADEVYVLDNILKKLQALKFMSAYIYLFKEPRIAYKISDIKREKEIYLAAYLSNGNIHTMDEENWIPADDFESLRNILQTESRYTAVNYSLFANEEQYGIVAYNLDLENFSFAYTVSLQIGTALKFFYLMRRQMTMQKQLEATLLEVNKKNDLLSQISVMDELTGLYNRRGLFEKMNEMISENKGKMAVLLFMDMDNLKGVNDIFGHNEGDYSLKELAFILRKSFRKNDLIGRIGGDEFAAFAVLDEPGLLHKILKIMDAFTKQLNNENGKPYYIEMSIGYNEFICKSGMSLHSVLNQADQSLYADKKNKRSSCVKEEQ